MRLVSTIKAHKAERISIIQKPGTDYVKKSPGKRKMLENASQDGWQKIVPLGICGSDCL